MNHLENLFGHFLLTFQSTSNLLTKLKGARYKNYVLVQKSLSNNSWAEHSRCENCDLTNARSFYFAGAPENTG